MLPTRTSRPPGGADGTGGSGGSIAIRQSPPRAVTGHYAFLKKNWTVSRLPGDMMIQSCVY
jgi:hypothetical protein